MWILRLILLMAVIILAVRILWGKVSPLVFVIGGVIIGAYATLIIIGGIYNWHKEPKPVSSENAPLSFIQRMNPELNKPEQPPVPVPTPQLAGGSAEKQNPSSEKKDSSTGTQKPEESVDKDGKTEKEPPPEVPTTDIDQVSSKLDKLKSTDEEIQQQVNQLTLQILQNKLGEAEKKLYELKNKNLSLKTDVNTFENRPLIKRIKELQEQIDSFNRELQAKRQREQELQIAELEEPVSRPRKPLSGKKAGGRLKVLTTGSCSVWQQVGATCRNISNLKGTLRGFI